MTGLRCAARACTVPLTTEIAVAIYPVIGGAHYSAHSTTGFFMTTVPTLTNPDMTARIARVTALARTPGHVSGTAPDAVDIEAWGHVGDPLAEDLISEMRERKLMGGDLFLSARSLETSGLPAAVAFFADVESVPEWADFDLMKSGARMGNRNPLGMLLGFHGGLAFTYIDPATATVMGSTGRLTDPGMVFRRRYWETARGFMGALDVDGMRPGGASWEHWVRIRLMHTMIRLGIERGGRWDYTEGAPISQLATASCAHIFGTYRVEIICISTCTRRARTPARSPTT